MTFNDLQHIRSQYSKCANVPEHNPMVNGSPCPIPLGRGGTLTTLWTWYRTGRPPWGQGGRGGEMRTKKVEKGAELLHDMCSALGLHDIWKLQHPLDKEFTFFSKRKQVAFAYRRIF